MNFNNHCFKKQRIKLQVFAFFFLSVSWVFSQSQQTLSFSDIILSLNKLQTNGRVLYLAAHPDDENTRLIAYLVNQKYIRTAYLSMTRGEGGQNLIGAEKGIDLGLIRTQELIAARSIDGAEQFFTRAHDFGYSKSPDETLAYWNQDSILKDIVWVIRSFKPDAIITRFATDGSGGHGHHTASALLAEKAFDMAGNATFFTDQLKHVSVWQPSFLFHNSTLRFRNPNADMSAFLKVNVGTYQDILGKSCGEIAAESRSMHKSQGFGAAKQRGDMFEYFVRLKGDSTQAAQYLNRLTTQSSYLQDSVSVLASQALNDLSINEPERILPILFRIHHWCIKENNTYKKNLTENLIAALSGLYININSTQKWTVVNDTMRCVLSAIKRKNVSVVLQSVQLITTDNQHIVVDTALNWTLTTNTPITLTKTILTTPFLPSQPYWINDYLRLHQPINQHFDQPEKHPLIARLKIKIQDYEWVYERPVMYQEVLPDEGERQHQLTLVPELNLTAENSILVFNHLKPQQLNVRVEGLKNNLTARVSLTLPDGWTSEPQFKDIVLQNARQPQHISFTITPTKTQGKAISITAQIDNQRIYQHHIKTIAYPHIPTQTWLDNATIPIVQANLTIRKKKIGYIMGSGDDVPECLKAMGYDVTLLSKDNLTLSQLIQYPTIIFGVRALNTFPALLDMKKTFWEYAHAGGNLIIQYNTNSWVGSLKDTFTPYPFELSRDRVTDEHSPVQLRDAAHPIWHYPNAITLEDFDGWVQERGIYFAQNIAPQFATPLALKDPAEDWLKGSLIIAPYGKGHITYTGLAFFRQLPAGVGGAYRIFNNLIEMQ